METKGYIPIAGIMISSHIGAKKRGDCGWPSVCSKNGITTAIYIHPDDVEWFNGLFKKEKEVIENEN